MSTRPAIVRGVAEIVLNVRDIEKMQRFYEEIFGFQLHSRFPEPDPTIIFLTIHDQESALSRGGHPVLLALIDPLRHGPAKGRFDGINRRQSSLNHLAFEIDRRDYESQKTRLEELGLEPRPEVFPFLKAMALFFEDPEGNLLEFICHDGSMG